MEKETRSGLIRATVVYFVIAAIMGILSFGSTLTVGEIGSFLPYIPPDMSGVGVYVLFVPLLVGISFFYVSILIGALFEGTINRVIISGLYAGGFSSFIVVFMIIQPISETTQVAGYLFMGSFAIYFIYSIISVIAELRDQHYLRVISGALAIFILGQVCIQLVNLYMVAPGVPETEQVTLIKEMMNIGFGVASGITLVGIFRDSRNVYLSQFGGIASNYFFVTALSLIGTLYLNFIGGKLTEVNPVIKQLSPYIEWTGVVIVGAFIFTVMRRGITETMMVPTELGDWGKHVQDTSSTKGKQLKDFTEMIKEFVDRGQKERLIVKLFRFLNENRASEPEMGQCLKELIDYEDQTHPNFAKRGSSKKVDDNNQERRMLILARTVQHINALGLGAYRSTGQNQVTEEIKEN
ncbi:hypothetical protein H8D76_00515 [Candidatus Bathyarchaeota archaeon]|nr:hypothetical protein [Candidatus Bathyarchaeota archaeon]